MKNYKNLIYLILLILHQLKCFDILSDDPYYKNIQFIEEGQKLLLVYRNDQFGDYNIIDENSDYEYSEILTDKIPLSYTSTNYQYVEIEDIFNHFLYTSYKNDTNYNLKLIIYDSEMASDFNIESSSIIPNLVVVYVSEKINLFFLEINYINIMLILLLMIM